MGSTIICRVSGLRYKVDRSHTWFIRELDHPPSPFSRFARIFRKLVAVPHFIGAIPAELHRPKTNSAAGCPNTTANIRSIL